MAAVFPSPAISPPLQELRQKQKTQKLYVTEKPQKYQLLCPEDVGGGNKGKTKTKLQLNIGDSLNVSLQETFPDQC